ncbi:MAG: Signaling protein, partial [Phycisphaerales bacterium]|nr:Signaling protein [Phycisphaerales bacterium]
HILGNDFWIYNDLAGAIAQAKQSNKPIFVTFRCVPCKNCAGFDAEVAKGSEGIKKLAQDKFVSLRQVEMKGVDLSQFQFDYDLNWAAMFINADGTVYARYGTQSIDGPDAYNSIASLEKTMQRVLELHDNYEKVKASLAAKRGPDKPYKTALEMPGMENKEKLAGTTVRNNCVHCHMIHDAEQNQWRTEGTMSLENLYRWPLPDNVGMHIDPKDGRKIETILPNSPAAKAGLTPGDEVVTVAGQPITSVADIQWPLQNLPKTDATVEVTLLHDGQPTTKTLALASGWKKTDFLWRASRHSLRPQPGFWAPALNEKQLKDLGDAIPAGVKPLRIQFINNNRPEGQAVRKAGLKEGDVIIALNGEPFAFPTPDAFQMHVRLNQKPGDVLKLKVLRNAKPIDIDLTLVE